MAPVTLGKVLQDGAAGRMATADLVARTINDDQVRDKRDECARQIIASLPQVFPALEAAPAERAHLGNILNELLDKQLSTVCSIAWKKVARELEETAGLRDKIASLEGKLASVTRNALLEINQLKKSVRGGPTALPDQAEADEAPGTVSFFEPLQGLSEDVRASAILVIQRKMHAMFEKDPSLKDCVNQVEVLRVEVDALRHNLDCTERELTSHRAEVKDLTERLKKSSGVNENQAQKLRMVEQLNTGLEEQKADLISEIGSLKSAPWLSSLAGRPAGPLARWPTGCLAAWLPGLLASWLAWLFGWLADWLVGWLAGWLIGWLGGWLSGWVVGWLAGWLAG